MEVFWPPPMITMLQWDPFIVNPGESVTFSATAINEVGVLLFEWDFDGDGAPDATSPAVPPGGQEASGSIVYTYTGDISTFPAVRALDNDFFISPWDIYDIDGQPVQLVVGEGSEQLPISIMEQWDPYSESGPDGLPTTTFTFYASGFDVVGVDRFEWDFDGDGTVDAISEADGETSVIATTTHNYNAVGTWTPQVRVVNVNGVESLWSAYVPEIMPIELETASPPMNPELNFTPRAEGDVGYDGTTTTTFTFTVAHDNSPISFQWDFDGDGDVDETTTSPTATYAYPAHGSFIASVTLVDEWGATALATPLDGLGDWETVDVSPLGPSVMMNQWSPYSASGADGNKHTEFTFSADVTALAGIATVQWDFDGDGDVDETTPIIELLTSTTATETFTFGTDGTYTPSVRAVDLLGQTSPWDQYNEASAIMTLDVLTPAPLATLNLWSPYSATGFDGNTNTVFGFSASATSELGIDRFEWDFDGDGTVDAVTEANGETSISATATRTYDTSGNYTPAVRVIDVDGVASAWDPYNESATIIILDVDNPPSNNNDSPVSVAGPDQTVLLGSTVTLDGTESFDPDSSVSLEYLWSQLSGPLSVTLDESNPAMPTFVASPAGTYVFELKVEDNDGAQSVPDSVVITVVSAPSATMNGWGPYSSSAPDGDEDTEFTFSADVSAEAGILRVEWDFDGDGTVDATTNISGAPTALTGATSTHVYGTDGAYTPKVRVVDVAGNTSAWDAFNDSSGIITLDVFTPPVAGETYCDNMTIEQLIASGGYHIIDKRNSTVVNIYGSSGADLILGNDLSNYIDGRGGDDCIIAFGGNDTVYDYKGNSSAGGTDWLFGGDGNDKLYALNGDDYVYGGNGSDEIYGASGNDRLYGEAGDDKIYGESGNDLHDGGEGADICVDTSGTNTFVSCENIQAPAATMNQWAPYNASGPDGTPATAFTFSATGTGSGIASFQWDFDGNGTVDATTAVSGSPSSVTKTATYTYNAIGTFTPMVRVIDTSGQTSAWDVFNSGSIAVQLETVSPPSTETYCNNLTIEQLIASGNYNVIDKRGNSVMLIVGTSGADLILGNNYRNNIHAGSGNDCVIAGGGDDVVFGGDGNDQIYGGIGNDWIYGQKGDDKEYGQDGNDFIHGLIDSNVLDGGNGNDFIVSGPKNNVIYAGAGDDVVHAGSGNDTVYGGAGDDELFGHEGNDKIYGESGEDKIHGGSGNDTIDGGSNNDWCYGGSGSNTVTNCEVSKSFSEDAHPSGGEDDDDHDRNHGRYDNDDRDNDKSRDNDDHDRGHGNNDDYDDDDNRGKSDNSKGKTKNR
ncbi:PKD domain-containing protein [Candidatus Nitrososphaera sp. FF02]|uniref:PKD domain-containing protein n=1 Tax=Candidatus Nitrososphaera sp. FF02 TaxID=3398226 RepID=UPI0039EA5FDE